MPFAEDIVSAVGAALLHAVLDEEHGELLGDVNMLLDAIKDFQKGNREAHLVEHVVVFGNFMRVGHVDEDVFGDAGVVGDQVGELRRAHVNVEHHLFVGI